MKRLLNHLRSICTWIVLAALAGFAGVARGQVQQLVVTENSSTSLTATLNGNPLTVAFDGSQFWSIDMSGSLLGGPGAGVFWREPENPTTEANQVAFAGPEIFIHSDLPPVTGQPLLDNGATDTTDFFINASPVDVTFNDNGDAASAPDTTATFSLLAVSLAALAVLKRSRFFSHAAA